MKSIFDKTNSANQTCSKKVQILNSSHRVLHIITACHVLPSLLMSHLSNTSWAICRHKSSLLAPLKIISCQKDSFFSSSIWLDSIAVAIFDDIVELVLDQSEPTRRNSGRRSISANVSHNSSNIWNSDFRDKKNLYLRTSFISKWSWNILLQQLSILHMKMTPDIVFFTHLFL